MGSGLCYNPPPFFHPLPSIPSAPQHMTLHMTSQPPQPQQPQVVPALPVQPEPHLVPLPPSVSCHRLPMAIDPKDVPLLTPSTDSASLSYQTLSPSSQPVSPRTQQIIQHICQEAVVLASSSASSPRGRASTREAQDLCNALADMFGLPPLPIPQCTLARSSSPMATISQSQSHHDKLRQSPAAPTVPTTRCHSPEPEEPSK